MKRYAPSVHNATRKPTPKHANILTTLFSFFRRVR
jgi:hypothetical protein